MSNNIPNAGYQDGPREGYPSAPPPSYKPDEHTYQPQSQPNYHNDYAHQDPEENRGIELGGGVNNRQSFITRVYAILAVQLSITFIPVVCISVIDKEATQEWVKDNASTVNALLWVSIAVSFTILFGMACCCSSIAKKTPWNYLLLLVFTLSEAFMLTFISLTYDTDIVLIALAGTAAITICVSLFSAFTRFDFTKAIHVMGIILLIWVLLSWMFAIFNWSSVLYGYIGLTIFTIYLAIDTQLIMGGKKYEISEEDYIFAALALYLDIINIFLYLLAILQGE